MKPTNTLCGQMQSDSLLKRTVGLHIFEIWFQMFNKSCNYDVRLIFYTNPHLLKMQKQ
jgi:hypothetical protein